MIQHDRTPPHSDEAEMCLLGSMLLDSRCLDDIADVIRTPDQFYREPHQLIYTTIAGTHEKTGRVDLVLIEQRLKDADALEPVGGVGYLIDLAESVPSAANAIFYARIVADKARRRDLIDACDESIHEAYTAPDDDDVIAAAEARVFAVSEVASASESESIDAVYRRNIQQWVAGGNTTGLETGFDDLDYLIGGLNPGAMYTLGARPAMGKSALGANVAAAVAGAGHPVLFVSLEMSKDELAKRWLSSFSGVEMGRFGGRLGATPKESAMLMEAGDTLDGLPLFIDDTGGQTMAQIASRARREVRRRGVKLLVLDYLQLILPSKETARHSREAQVSEVSRSVKALAKNLNIPVLCLAQLNRGVEGREDKTPRLQDLRESGSIEQDSDVVMLLHREAYYHQDDADWISKNEVRMDEARVTVAKQRNGPTGPVDLTWNGATATFSDRRV